MKITDPIGPGHVYGCHSDIAGHDKPRGGKKTVVSNSHTIRMAGGTFARQMIAPVTTDWKPIACGHNLRISDPSCTGCANRAREE